MVYAGSAVVLVIFLSLGLLLGNQRVAYAQVVPVTPCDVFDNLPMPPGTCDGNGGGTTDPAPTPVDPCDIFDAMHPLPPQCGNGGGNGGGGDGGGTPTCDAGEHLNDQDQCVPDDTGGGTDACPDIDGIQTDTSECPPDNGGGGSGGSTDSSDTGGGGGGGGDRPDDGGLSFNTGSDGEEVLGTTTEATTAPISCDTYLTAFIKSGQKNDPDQVKRLQGILKSFEGADLEESGSYDSKTLGAVKGFQGKYASEILAPWGIKEPTGFVYLTTRKKMNEVYCKNTKTFPLTKDEEDQIAHVRDARTPNVAKKAPEAQASKPIVPVMQEEKPDDAQLTTSSSEKKSSAVDLPGSSISNFFRRLFNRFR